MGDDDIDFEAHTLAAQMRTAAATESILGWVRLLGILAIAGLVLGALAALS